MSTSKGWERSMKIGIDLRTLSFRRGGISQYTYHLLKNMLRIDSTNDYFLFNYTKTPYAWENFRQNVKEIIVRLPQRRALKAIWENLLVPLAIRRYGIGVWFSPDFIIPRLLHTRTVVTIHDLIFENFHDVQRNKLAAAMSRKTEFSVKRATGIIAVSSFTRGQILERYGVPPGKITVIHEAADERFHKIDDRSALQRVLHRYGIAFDYILYVGEISGRKNIVRLLDAYHRLKNQHKMKERKLVLVGKETIDTRKILSEMRRLSLESDVVFTGWIPDEDLPFLYNGAVAFVFPSLYEGFGIPPLEAMQCQVPVIASSATSIPEVVGTGALLFDPYNVEDIADKLDQVLDRKIDLDALLRAGLKQADQFSWEDSARKTIALLETVGQGIQR
jgi:glycosyltransferase involved in cell wall biosynthesis